MAGSNDLNMLLKAQVVKIRAEIDLKGSMPKIRQQVNTITKRLKANPVKLNVRLDYKLSELFSQRKAIQNRLNALPIKLSVMLDMGGMKGFHGQVNEMNRVVNDFNNKTRQQAQTTGKVMRDSVNIPASAHAKNFNNIKQYNNALRDAERILRSKVPKGQGLFSSTQFKDAKGNMTGFVAQIERANGIVEKVRYEWDSKASQFTPINRQTVNSLQKHVHSASQSLRSLYADIEQLNKGQAQHNLFKQYENLEKRIGNETLTKDAVKNLQAQIREEKVLQQNVDKTNNEYIARQRLMRDIRVARDREIQRDPSVDVKPYQNMIKNVREGTKSVQEQRLELQKLNDTNKKRQSAEKEIQANTKKRIQLLQQLRKIERQTPTSDETSQRLIRELRFMGQRATKGKEWIAIQKRMNDLQNSNANARELRESIDLQDRMARKIKEVGALQGRTNDEVARSLRDMRRIAITSFADLEKEYHKVDRRLKRLRAENRKAVSEGQMLISGRTQDMNQRGQLGLIQSAVKAGDTVALQNYIGQLYKGKVETLEMRTATDSMGRAVDQMRVKMAGTGKTVQAYTLNLDRATGSLIQANQATVYNANRNLGVMEQLKIAMARVPVWMSAMTAFYGSIRAVRAMTREILEVDKALTELRRVASEDLSIEGVFRGAVGLSKELGNNIHDVMQTLNDFSRTFGEFNERQLLAITNTATLMSNVSELGAQEAGETLIATMNAFNIEAEESIRIVDAFNEVDNNFAVSTMQLSEGMSKTASTAQTFGVTLEESIGHITAISSVTQESGRLIGNSLKTIYSRITTMKGAENILESIGISIKEIGTNGEEYVRPVQDILSELGNKWHDLTDSQRQNIGVTVAGRYQLSRFLAMMNNWDTAVDATTTALSSQGSAMRENDEYLKSFEARINQLKNGFTELALSVGDAVLSDGMMGLIELGKTLAETVTTLIDRFGALPALFLLISGILGKFGVFSKYHGMLVRFMESFPMLGRNARRASKDMEVAQKAMIGTATTARSVDGAMKGATIATRTFGGVLRATLASTGIGLLFVGFGMLVEHFISKTAEAKREAEEFEKQQKATLDAYHQMGSSDGLTKLIEEYETLNEISQRTAEQEQRYQEIRASLVNNFPSMVDSYDAEGEAILKSADLMKEEINSLEELSQARANVIKEEFRKDLKEEVQGWSDIAKEIDKVTESLNKLSKNKGIEVNEYDLTSRVGMAQMASDMKSGNATVEYNGNIAKVTIDHNETIANQELKILELQQKRSNTLQGINKRISQQTLAYMEVDGVMSKLSESQIRAIEDYSASHTKSIDKRLKELDAEGASNEEIVNFLERKGESIANRGNEIAKAYSEAFEQVFASTDGTQASMNTVRESVDAVSDALGENFYKWKDIGDVNNQIKELAEVSYEMKTAGVDSYDSLIERVSKFTGSTEEATQIVGELAREQKNSEIYQRAMKDGFDETTESIDNMNESLLEAIDLTSILLGEGASDEMNALESQISLIMLYNDALGDSAKEHWEYNESLNGVKTALGLTDEQLNDNIENIAFLTKVTGELNPTLNDTATEISAFNKLSDEQADKLKNLGISQDDLLKKYIEHQDWQIAILDVLGLMNAERDEEAEKAKESAEATKEDTEAKRDNKEAIEAQQQAVDTLNEKFENFKANSSTMNRSQWIDTIKTQMSELDGQIEITKDEAGNLKLVMADGSQSEWLNTVNSQIEDLGIDMLLTKDEAGNLKLVLNDGTGSSTLTAIEEGAKDAKTVLGDVIKEHDIMQERTKTLPNDYTQIDFKLLYGGLDTAIEKVGFLSEALDGVWENTQEVANLEGMFDTLSGKMANLEENMKRMFDGSVGSLEDMQKRAEMTETAVDNLKEALDELSQKSGVINLDGFNDAREAIIEAKNAVESFEREYLKVIDTVSRIANAVGTSSSMIMMFIIRQKNEMDKMGITYKMTARDIIRAFESMTSTVVARTNSMIGRHNAQRDAIRTLASSARDARRDISNLNSSANSAMGTLDRYITRANRAISVGNRVPNAPSSGGILGRLFGGSSVEGSESSVSTFSASVGGEGASSEGGGGAGTSGIVQPSLYTGGVDANGGYVFNAFNLADPYKPNYNERYMTAYQGNIGQIEAMMKRMNENTLKYRNSLQDIIYYQNLNLKLSRDELRVTVNRNAWVNKRLKQLNNVGRHTEKQREEYNKLQQEYDSNLSKIASLKAEVENITTSIGENSLAIFNDYIDEIIGNYNKLIDNINKRTGDIDFQLDLMGITDPNNIQGATDLNVKKVVELVKYQQNLDNLQKELNRQLVRATKEYGKNSKEAKRLRDELETVEQTVRDITLQLARTEKEIKDMRTSVADDGISTLKKYYKEVSNMITKAIDLEIDSMRKAHEEKMSQYDEEISKINEIYDERINKMDEEKAEKEYQAQVDDLNSKKQELLERKRLQALDTSVQGRKRLNDTEMELAEVEAQLDEVRSKRKEELLRAEMDRQREEQIKNLELQKEVADTELEQKIERLEEEKENMTKFYEDLINNDRYWAEVRNEFIEGNFTVLTTEINKMQQVLKDMDEGVFDSLETGFFKISDAVRTEISEINEILIDNLNFEVDAVVKKINEVQNALKLEVQKAQQAQKKVTPPKTTPKKTTASSSSKSSSSSSSSKSSSSSSKSSKPSVGDLPLVRKKYATPRGGWDKHSVVDYIKSKGYRSDFSDRNNVYRFLKGSGTYTGTAKQNDWLLKQLKIIGLRTGGYTGDDEGLAYLHKKELVLNEKQTSDILDTAKIMDRAKNVLPKIERNVMSNNYGGTTTGGDITYGDIHVTVENGDKKKAKDIASEILKGMKKRGR